jgi:polyhydroxyalkanoate synthesis repressor PhaR
MHLLFSNPPPFLEICFVAPRCATKATLDNMDPKPQSPAGGDEPSAEDRPRRIVKRYSNRKLYDTKDSRYVTLLQIAEMVRSGEEVQIIDNNSKQDLTEVTLAQIIYEEQKAHSRSVPLQTLKELLHARTEKVLSDLRETPIGRLIPGTSAGVKAGDEKSEEPRAKLVDTAKETLEDWQHKIDERVKALLLTPLQQLQGEVKRLSTRIEELEKKLKSTK